MDQFAQTARQTITNLSQGIGMGQLTEKHRNQLRPTREPLGCIFGPMLANQFLKLMTRDLGKQLTKQTGRPYHDDALLWWTRKGLRYIDSYPSQEGISMRRLKILFRTRVKGDQGGCFFRLAPAHPPVASAMLQVRRLDAFHERGLLPGPILG
jgi:hypothetical protein